MGSTVEQDRSHLDLLTKHVPRAVLDELAGMMGYTFPDEKTQKFQEYANINGHRKWQQLSFDDGENESLEDDVHSFVDKMCLLTTAISMRGVEMNILSQPYVHRSP